MKKVKTVKSGSAATSRSTSTYFKRLTFLQPTGQKKKSNSSLEEEDDNIHDVSESEDGNNASNFRPPVENPPTKERFKLHSADKHLSKFYCPSTQEKEYPVTGDTISELQNNIKRFCFNQTFGGNTQNTLIGGIARTSRGRKILALVNQDDGNVNSSNGLEKRNLSYEESIEDQSIGQFDIENIPIVMASDRINDNLLPIDLANCLDNFVENTSVFEGSEKKAYHRDITTIRMRTVSCHITRTTIWKINKI
nr:unnamed protein product [Callosobruchus chinensis]